MFLIRLMIAMLVALAASARAVGAPPGLIELKVGKEKYEGKVIAHNPQVFWLVGQDGALRILETERVSDFRKVSPQFRSWSSAVVRDQLQRELGRSFDIGATRHYLVGARGDQKARQYAETFEELFRTFQMYFSVRGFKVAEPEFPLVVIVFPSQPAFARYAEQDKVAVSRGLRGYYLTTSNRVALFEESGDTARRDVGETWLVDDDWPAWLDAGPRLVPFARLHGQACGAIEASLRDTMIHEATHQAAFNTGLHTRLGANPKWVVEGLATVFEAAGIRGSSANTGIKSRINPERLVWFGDFAKMRRQPQSLEAFIGSDEPFQQNVLDGYSQAWALTFFLIETRPRNYADLLKAMAARDPLTIYTAEARLADFHRTISKDLKLLEAEFLRFMKDIR